MSRPVLSVSVTEAGRARARRLPFEHIHGSAAATVRGRWGSVEGFVLFLASGAAVRIVAPLLTDKNRDPAVVCIDESGRYAVALVGGHAGGANALARQVGGLLDAEPVLTTGTDSAGCIALDTLPGFVATGDVAAVTAAMLDGCSPRVSNELDWPLPSGLTHGDAPEHIVVTDRREPPAPGTVTLHPPSLVAGVGASTGAPARDVSDLLEAAIEGAGLARPSITEVATLDRKTTEAGLQALGLPLRGFGAEALRAVPVPTPSAVVAGAVGTPSVAEAAALLSAGPGAELVVPKQANAVATVAIARRARPAGRLRIVGLGPGAPALRTPAAETAVRHAQVVIGYAPYVDSCADLLEPHHEVVRSPIGEEVVRAKQALAEAAGGREVALVCSGDPGVYAMASIALELAADAPGAEIETVPGVTAALASSAAVGAPLGHDFATISLSDLLTPWEAIEARVRAAATADFALALYNPRSERRTWQLDAARRILLEHRAPSTPVAVVTDATRSDEHVQVTTLADLDPTAAGMTTCVLVGASTTRVVDGRVVTPRGYRP
ncbi:MAG TPA: precorrin-3B C(17)-methyltransferase [Acidimicrobiia bacterium]|jgi:cobalt-precorrin 5A hydrolase/precorrin-3B C17-methyltransferase